MCFASVVYWLLARLMGAKVTRTLLFRERERERLESATATWAMSQSENPTKFGPQRMGRIRARWRMKCPEGGPIRRNKCQEKFCHPLRTIIRYKMKDPSFVWKMDHFTDRPWVIISNRTSVTCGSFTSTGFFQTWRFSGRDEKGGIIITVPWHCFFCLFVPYDVYHHFLYDEFWIWSQVSRQMAL